MKFNGRLKVLFATLTVTSLLVIFSTHATAATFSFSGTVKAEVNGQPIAAIAVGNTTYLNWGALQRMNTPYQYLGNGKFAITGGNLQGVIYQGNTYLPWASVAPKVKATGLKGGGFNFTELPVAHDYHVAIIAQNGTVGRPDAVEIMANDGGKLIPHQTVQLTLAGGGFVSGHGQDTSIRLTTNASGVWFGALNDTHAEKVSLTLTWTDPSGKAHSGTTQVTFSSAASTSAVTAPALPPGDVAMATVPVTTFQNALLFNAQGAGQDLLFQLDTGAYEPVITKQVADLLHLPNLGPTLIQGVTGQDTAYFSQMSLTIGGHPFLNIPCLVDDNYSGPSLFGYGFFASNGYDLLVSQKDHSFSILK